MALRPSRPVQPATRRLRAPAPPPPGPILAPLRRFLASPSTAASPAAGASVDPREAAKFGALAASWWSPSGPFAPLHALNPARVRFVRESLAACRGGDAGAPEPLKGLRVLDVGCGGGVLSESLARLGASVTGIDVAAASVAVAAAHAGGDPLVAGRVSYRCISAEDLAASGTGGFDAVIASEVLEHVRRPHDFLAVLASLLAPPEASPGAAVIISTINRTPAAWAFAIAGAEYVARVVPPGTHSFKKFVTPQELAIMADASGLKLWHASGMAPLGPGGAWALTGALDVNYIATLRRAGEVQAGGAEGPGAGPGAEAGAGAGAERQ
ncbi:hypothetical protein HYH03_009144 [Edaphochlamys debaryana]|uniref:Ubiquinone biosynthesis O-methyltransferase, mitochondrial n=1 Tax=Edaphochlamys debaryana TaxID=47281 RepID=A0A835XZA1_9CHLO|nr:hypothetical protein HYH03_009144 [Edaphochlamys debaryana]|eukprot:KAG2492479.1 hypothetical protein HYH03_009144 [Edaphochlamys debaryana]